MILESLSKVGGEYRATFPWTKWCFVSFCRIKWGDLFCSKWIVTSQFCKLFKDKNFPTFFGSNDHFFLLPFLGKFNFLIRQGKKMQVWTWIYCSLQLGDRLSLMCSKGLLECAFFKGGSEVQVLFLLPHCMYNALNLQSNLLSVSSSWIDHSFLSFLKVHSHSKSFTLNLLILRSSNTLYWWV